MTRQAFMLSLLAGCLTTLLPATLPSAFATQPTMAQGTADVRQLMTDKEQTEFRARMWAAKTDEERNRIRTEHHEEMKKRALAKGMSLPDAPPPMHDGMGLGAPGHMGPRDDMKRPDSAGPRPPCAASAPRCHEMGSRHRHHARRHHRAMQPDGVMPPKADAPKTKP